MLQCCVNVNNDYPYWPQFATSDEEHDYIFISIEGVGERCQPAYINYR